MFLNFFFKKGTTFLGLFLMIILLAYLYNNPEFIRKSLYFFETNFAPVLLPLAASPSHAILKDLFIKTMFN